MMKDTPSKDKYIQLASEKFLLVVVLGILVMGLILKFTILAGITDLLIVPALFLCGIFLGINYFFKIFKIKVFPKWLYFILIGAFLLIIYFIFKIWTTDGLSKDIYKFFFDIFIS
mgnify:CR=1 FL=1